MVVRLVNMLRSGRCASLGGGGLGGGLAYRVGLGVSGSSISLFREFLDAAREFGDDMLACIDDRGSAMIGGGNEL
jgi:hypothetical protein